MYAFIKIKQFPYLEGYKLKQIHNTTTRECAILEGTSVFNSKYEFILNDEDGEKLIEQLKPLTEKHTAEVSNVYRNFENQLENILDTYKKIT